MWISHPPSPIANSPGTNATKIAALLSYITSTLYISMMRATSKRKPFNFRLDLHSGVPVYRQIIDQVIGGLAANTLRAGDQLPTVRQLAVDLSINPNTVIRAYRELEIRGVLETQQGTGTFISSQKPQRDDADRRRRLNQLVGEFIARAGSEGYTVEDLLEQLESLQGNTQRKKRR
jgi:GntR family transcriptional regulator